MWLIPVFQIGLWNGWILVLPLFLVFVAGSIVSREKFDQPPADEKEKRLNIATSVAVFVCFLCPIALPLKLGTIWLHVGLGIHVVGLAFATVAEAQFALAPKDTLITTWSYRVSRNPMYLGGLLVFVGTAMACTSWVYLMPCAAFALLTNLGVISEERLCLQKYGDAFRAYMSRTPRWLGIPRTKE